MARRNLAEVKDEIIQEALERLKPVYDPELGISVVDLGLIYDIRYNDDTIEVDMTLTTPACPIGPLLMTMVEDALRNWKFKNVKVNLVWDPPYDPHTMASEYAKELLGIW